MIYHVIIQQIDRKATVQKFLDPTSEDNAVPLPHLSSARISMNS